MSLSVAPVRFEHHRESLGIGEAAPRLSWIVEQAPAGWRQASCVLEARADVGAAPATIEVPSSESVLVEWPFPPLSSRERREVRVRVVGSDGTAAWSEWSGVEAGLLDADDWVAEMVGPVAGSRADVASPLVRGELELASAPVRARLYGTAHGLVEFQLNGERVGSEELAPGWTAYESRLRYRTHDVTALLRPGRNVLGAWLGDGWWRGRLGWDGRRAIYGDALGVLAQLEVEYADGTTAIFGSSTGWRAAPSAIEAADLYDGESFDARRFDPAWSTPEFDASDWETAARRDLDTTTLVAPDGPPVRVTETLAVREVLTSPSGATILDFGQNFVGRLRITVQGEAGGRVTLRHAEVLQGGELATEPLRTAKATDEYVLVGGQPETWAPRFTFHGFRYAEVTGWPGRLDAGAVVAEVLHTDFEATGAFEISDPLVQRLHENVRWGMRGNFLDVPTDCPQRDERLGWTGDLQVFAPTAAFLGDVSGFLASWLRDLEAEQRRLGGVPMVVPAVTTGAATPTAGWADAATVVPWTLWERYGDLEVLRRQFDSMAAWVEQVAELAGPDRLWNSGYQFGDWLDPAAPAERPDAARTATEIVATAYFARSARIVADAAALLGREADRERFAALAEEVRDAFHREYLTAAGRMLSDAPTAYALALRFDLVGNDAERQRAADRLADLVRSGGYRIATGFIGTPLIADALSAHGHADTAYRLLLQTENPSWLYAVKQGATTIWERWDSLVPDGTVNPSGMTSFNHYAFGAIADWLHRVVAGLAPAAPGYRRIRFAPVPPRRDITSAGARLRTPYGDATSEWAIGDGELRLRVTIPVGVIGDVVLPSGVEHAGLEHGVHEFAEPFEVEVVERRTVSVDTRLADLVDDPDGMAVLMGVVTKYVPEAAAHMSAGLNGQDDVTPRQIAGMLPHSEAVLADLERGFAAVSAGEAVPDEVLRAPEPRADDDLLELAQAVGGDSFWSAGGSAGIRPIVLTDGPHGVRRQRGDADHVGLNTSEPATCFPTASAIASSWDPALVEEVGVALGTEARALDVDVLLGPGINIKRSPLGGRNFEYFSEDPRLAGELAVGWVRGVQSTGVGASLKHFAVNNQETDRMRVSAEVDERTLRELYLPAFERVVTEAAPATVMSAYNAVNGVFASENRWLLTELLRGEWGFQGAVVSDWGAVKDRVEALLAGLDLEMPGPRAESVAAIAEAVRAGRVDRGTLERAVARIAALADRTEPGTDTPSAFDADAHHRLARRAAAESIVLLRNEDAALPLREGARVLVVGELAARPAFQGNGSSRVVPTRIDTPLDALHAALGSVEYAAGYSADGNWADGDAERLRDEAVTAVRDSDIAVVVVGLPEAEQSEGFDREHLDLPPAQVDVLRAVARVADRTVVVLLNGGVVTLEPWHDEVDAIVEAWAGGQAVGAAVADVLTGAVNPSGRLAETIPVRLEDTPSYLNFPGEHHVVRYGEGVFVGYRHSETVGVRPRYPFGHGLSYTTFEYGAPTVDVTGPDTVRVSVPIRNSGRRAGAEVVQIYVAPPSVPVRRPRRELGGFAKVRLEADESTTVVVELERRAFAYWDVARGGWRVEPADYGIEVARSASDIVARIDVRLDGDSDVPPPLTLESTVKEWFGHPVVGPVLMEGMLANATEEQKGAADALKMVESMPMGQFAQFPGVGLTEQTLEGLMAMSRSD